MTKVHYLMLAECIARARREARSEPEHVALDRAAKYIAEAIAKRTRGFDIALFLRNAGVP